MERIETIGIGASVAGHAALFAVMALVAINAAREPAPPAAMEVSYVDEAGPVSASPEPAPSAAPVAAEQFGPVEQAAPTPETSTAPAAAPSPSPALQQAQPRPAPQRGSGSAEQTRGSPLRIDLSGIGDDAASPNRSAGAVLSQQTLASIQALIQRQIQPCAGRRRNLLGDGAERIRVTLNLRLRRDGSLSAAPTVVAGRTTGLDDQNRRYAGQVGELIVAAVRECSPLRNLPAEYYATPSGGWGNINVNFRLPG